MKPRIKSMIWNIWKYKFTQSEQWKEKKNPKNKDSARGLWDNFKCTNIDIIGVPKGEKREQDIENLCKTMTETFPNVVKKIGIQVQEVQTVSNQRHSKRPTPRHIIFKMQSLKTKRIIKAEREKQLLTCMGAPIRLSADFSTESFQTRGDWQEIFQVMKTRTYKQDYCTWQSYHLETQDR